MAGVSAVRSPPIHGTLPLQKPPFMARRFELEIESNELAWHEKCDCQDESMFDMASLVATFLSKFPKVLYLEIADCRWDCPDEILYDFAVLDDIKVVNVEGFGPEIEIHVKDLMISRRNPILKAMYRRLRKFVQQHEADGDAQPQKPGLL